MTEEEKEFRNREKVMKEWGEKMKGQTGELLASIERHFTPFQKQLDILANPLEKKTVSIDEKSVAVFLLKDGRVLFNFADVTSAMNFYQQTKDGFWRRIWKKIR